MPHSHLKVVRHRPPEQPRSRRFSFLRRKRRSDQSSKKKKFFRFWLKRLFWIGVVVVLIFIIYLVGAFAWYSRSLPNPDKILERNLVESTKIYDRKGETVLYDIHGDKMRTLVKLDDIPEYMRWATVSAEDHFFYEHGGVNFIAMFKGVILDPLRGRRARGGSTLTQQFVKNAILTNERRISRKIKEFVLSYKIEKIFDKDQILQMYLNEIPYGSVSYGVQSAAQTYFGKNVKDISLAEAAMLASLPKAPTYYSPYGSHTDDLWARQQYILDQMFEFGYIDGETKEAAKNEKVEFIQRKESIIAPHFVMYVKEILSEELGDELIEQGGLKVITSLDLEKQEIAEEAVVNGVEARGGQYNFHNAALVSLDPKTGEILAMVGSKDYFDTENDGNVNVTTRLRQPGSSIKPMVYAAAFEKGYTPNTILYDVNTTFKTETKDYSPQNYDLSERGPVTMRKALAGSLNIPAVKTIYLVGVQKVVDFLELMGYTSFEERSRFGLSLVLGGGEVRLIEHTAAFGVFANQGKSNRLAAILRVEDSKGNVLMSYDQLERKVLDRNIANTVTNVLSDNAARAYVFGEQNHLTLGNRPVAAKTGTTNDYRDAWTMGYTPSLVTGVWVGNNDNSEMKRGAAGGVVAAPIWNEYMRKALAGELIEGFSQPEIKMTGKAVLDGLVSPEKIVKIDKISGMLATDETPPELIEEKKFRDAHTILHYVYKDDPTGVGPKDPAQADSAYASWEAAVQDWLKRKSESGDDDFIFEAPPTEFDNVHTEENKPTIFINLPENNQTISANYLDVNVTAFAPRGLTRIEYYLSEKLLSTETRAPYSLHYPLSSYFVKGFHELKAVAYDDVDNKNETIIDLNINVDIPAPNLNWQNPSVPTSVDRANFPIVLQVQLTDVLASKRVQFLARHLDSGQTENIATIILPQNTAQHVSWTEPKQTGAYEIFAEITDPSDRKFISSKQTVIIN